MVLLEWLGAFLWTSLTTIVSLLIAIFALVRIKQRPYYSKLMAFPHNPEIIPFWTHICILSMLQWQKRKTGKCFTVLFMKYMLEIVEKNRDEGLFALFLGTEPWIGIFRADHVEKLLTSNSNITKGRVYKTLHPWLGFGVLTSTGAKWKQRRRLLTPAFHFHILDQFTGIMNRHAKIFNSRLESKAPTEDISPYMSAVTLDTVCETIMGVQMDIQTSGKGKAYLDSLKSMGKRVVDRFHSPSQWIDWIYERSQVYRDFVEDLKELHKFTAKVINERKAELEANPDELEKIAASEGGLLKSRKPFLDLLLVEHMKHKTMSKEDIQEEVDTFMFAGHDTTSMALTWAVYLIGLHPKIQSGMQKEIDEIFHGDVEAEVTAEHIKQMKYLEIVLKETQRLYPAVPEISRIITEEFTLNGKPVPVGTEVTCQIFALHRDPKVFPDPSKFDPDRFLPENCVGRNPFAFIPFSAGPRNCIGQRFALLEMKIILVWLLRKFNVKSLDPIDQIDCAVEMVLVPKTPIRIEFTARA